MAIKVKTRFGEAECDTAEEAFELWKLTSKAAPDKPLPDSSTASAVMNTNGHHGPIWVDVRYRTLVDSINENQRKFLQLLLNNPQGVQDDAVRTTLGLDNNMALAGVLAGLAKTLKRVGMPFDKLVTKQKRKIRGRKRVYHFTLNNDFRALEQKIGELARRA
jgi:hypothetical protein